MNDDRQQPATPAWRNAGVGHAMSFRCGACDLAKQISGRRLVFLRGLRTYVCAACAGPTRKKVR